MISTWSYDSYDNHSHTQFLSSVMYVYMLNICIHINCLWKANLWAKLGVIFQYKVQPVQTFIHPSSSEKLRVTIIVKVSDIPLPLE